MPRHSHDDLLRALGRRELQPVYYLFGSEDILKEEASRAIVDQALEPHERDFNFDQRSAAGLSPEDLHALVNTLPMMATRRVVVVRDIEAWKKKAAARDVLLRYLANPSSDTILLLVENAPANEEKRREYEPDGDLVARSYAVDFAELPPDRVARWVAHHAKRRGIVFAEGAAEHLASACGYDLGALRSELEKLAGLVDQEPITLTQVAELVGVRHGETLEDWVAAILGDATPRALRLGGRVLEQTGMSGVKMVSTLGGALVGLRLARAHYDKGTRGAALERVLMDRLRNLRAYGIGDWKQLTKAWSRGAESWPGPRLRQAIRDTLQADIALKGTRVSDDAGVIDGLALQLGVSASRRLGGSASERHNSVAGSGATR